MLLVRFDDEDIDDVDDDDVGIDIGDSKLVWHRQFSVNDGIVDGIILSMLGLLLSLLAISNLVIFGVRCDLYLF